jgi:hypothetical protein
MWRKLALVQAAFREIAEQHKDLLSYTRYAFNIRAWQENFGSENVLVLIHEDTQHARQAYIERICAFIGAESLDLESNVIRSRTHRANGVCSQKQAAGAPRTSAERLAGDSGLLATAESAPALLRILHGWW